MQKRTKIRLIIVSIPLLLILLVTFWILTKEGIIPNFLNIKALEGEQIYIVEKPVIYLYPEKEGDVSVKIDLNGGLLVTYPLYNNGWDVYAYPDGRLIDKKNGKEYKYLFWEGTCDSKYNMTEGFVVKGQDTQTFLEDILAKKGLIASEYNDFIVYWLPRMINNKYNLIHFATQEEYAEKTILDINPKPDSILRVFMVFKKLDRYIDIKPQDTTSFGRNGFSVVEWGGTEIE